MKRSEIKKGMEVAVVRGNERPYYGTVIETDAAKIVYHGSRDFRGSQQTGFIAVAVGLREPLVVPPNQVKDAEETRNADELQAARKAEAKARLEAQKQDAHNAVEMLNAKGIKCEVEARHAYGDYRITGWGVRMTSTQALELVAKLPF